MKKVILNDKSGVKVANLNKKIAKVVNEEVDYGSTREKVEEFWCGASKPVVYFHKWNLFVWWDWKNRENRCIRGSLQKTKVCVGHHTSKYDWLEM